MNKLARKNETRPSDTPDLADLNRIDPDRVADLQSSWRDQTLADHSRTSYRSDIEDLNQWLDENDRTVNGESIRAYLDHLEETHAPATLNRKRYSILKTLKTYGDGYAPLVNAIEEEIKKNTRTYETTNAVDGDTIPDKSDVGMLIDTAEYEGRDRLALIIKFLWRTAARISEALDIRPDRDIDINGRVKIRIRGKGNKERIVKIPTALYREIRETFDHPEADYLFHTSSGNQYNRSNLYKQLKRLGERIDVDHAVNPHAFRHARATWMLENGFSLKVVSQFLGHSSTSITADMYHHASMDYDRLDELDDRD